MVYRAKEIEGQDWRKVVKAHDQITIKKCTKQNLKREASAG